MVGASQVTLTWLDEDAVSPVPVRAITVEEPVAELLVRVSEPEAAPVVVGSNSMLSVAV